MRRILVAMMVVGVMVMASTDVRAQMVKIGSSVSTASSGDLFSEVIAAEAGDAAAQKTASGKLMPQPQKTPPVRIPAFQVPNLVILTQIDFDRIDPDRVVESGGLLWEWLDEMGMIPDEIRMAMSGGVQRGPMVPGMVLLLASTPEGARDLLRAGISQMRDVFGIDRMTFFMGTDSPNPGEPIGFAMNRSENPRLNETVLTMFLPMVMEGEVFPVADGGSVAVIPGMHGGNSVMAMGQMFGSVPAAFTTALQSPEIAACPVRWVLVTKAIEDNSVGQIFGETPAEKLAMLRMLRSVAIGCDPNTMRIVMEIRCKDAASARIVRTLLARRFTVALGELLDASELSGTDGSSLVERLVPAPRADDPALLQLIWTPEWFDDPVVARGMAAFGERVAQNMLEQQNVVHSMNVCLNNMRQIMLAMHNYHDATKSFPPVCTVDGDGKPLHSWRVLLLPYMEEIALYDQIRLDEPWDSPWNSQFHDRMPAVYRCDAAGRYGADPDRDTVYARIVGPTAQPLPGQMSSRGGGMTPSSSGMSERMSDARGNSAPQRGIGMANITDGTSNTIAIAERKTPVCWMQPDDADIIDESAIKGIDVEGSGIGAHHGDSPRDATPVAFYDGSVRPISNSIDPRVLQSVLGISDGEAVSASQVYAP